jgi:hypothetical protein
VHGVLGCVIASLGFVSPHCCWNRWNAAPSLVGFPFVISQTTIRDFIAFPKNNMGVLALAWGTARGFKQIEP